jgi:hypothetical protein
MCLTAFAMAAALLPCAARHAQAQAQGRHAWAFFGELGGPRYSGMISGDADSIEIVPARRTELRLGVERSVGSRASVSLLLATASPGVEARAPGASATIDETLDLYEVRPLIDLDLLRRNAGVQVSVGAGPVVQFWQPAGSGTRTRLAFESRVRVAAPFTTSLALTVSGEIGVTPSSWAHQDELPENHELRAIWRRGIFIGLRLGL